MSKTTLPSRLLVFVIILTNLTQMPQMIGSRLTSYINLGCWGLLLLYILVRHRLYIERTKFLVLLYAIAFILISLLLEVFTRNVYLQTALVYPYLLSVFVFIIGSLYSNIYDEIDIEKLYMAYVISGLVVSIAVFFYSFSSGFNWMSRAYAYTSKNSVAQIILTVILLMIFTDVGKKIPRLISCFTVLFLLILMAMLKSRASLVGVIAIIMYIVMSKKVSSKIKKITIAVTVIFCVLVYFNHTLNEIVIDGILFAGRNVNNLNDFSSGRWDMIVTAFDLLEENWIFGRGLYYLESFPLSLLIQYGVIGSIPIILHLVVPFSIIRRSKNKNNKIVIIAILICYYLNGLFEELAPLGPGVKCYFLWFLLGFERIGNSVKTYEA